MFSLFGARLFSWIFYFPPGINLWKALWDPAGGMVFYGGLVFGFLALLIYTRATKLPVWKMLDLFAPGLALGLAFGRIGCFMAGCCWGDVCIEPSALAHLPAKVTPWQIQTVPWLSHAGFPLAVTFPEHAAAFEQHQRLGLISPDATRSLPVHPVQLYEATLAFLLCIFLHRSRRDVAWNGQTLSFLLLGYGVIRFLTEIFRADNPPVYAGLTLSQVISLILLLTAGVILISKRALASSARRPALVQDSINVPLSR